MLSLTLTDKRKRRNLLNQCAVLEFFPKELWSTIDPTATETNGVIDTDTKGKSLQIPGYDNADVEHDMSGDEGEEKGPKDPEDEDMLEGEEVDDEFDDDDEEGGDYNAEQYFDDGGEDGGDDYDGGDEAPGDSYYS